VNEGDLAALLRQHASTHAVPGAAIGILHKGVATTAYYGVANARTGEPVTAETRFSVGSLTKSMVATVIARLAEWGWLSLDDLVARHVPELHESDWAKRATLRDLLANRSGLPLRADFEFGFDDRKDEDDGALGRFAAETVTDAAWEHSVRRHLLDPARMSETTLATDPAPKHRASGHEITPDGPVPVEPLISRAYGPAGTSAVSTVTDLLRFAGLHLGDPSLAALRAVQAPVSIYGWLDSWCLGWARFAWPGGQIWGWDGLVNGERSIMRIVPEQHAAVVMMTNGSTGRAMYRSLFAVLMESLFEISMPPLVLEAAPDAAGDLSRFAGVYAWPDWRVEVTATERGLVIKDEQDESEAIALDERTFLIDPADPDNPTVTFGDFDAADRPRVLYLMLWGLPRLDG
jgi:CubicO group peptidase (beta-lactamase class C family)